LPNTDNKVSQQHLQVIMGMFKPNDASKLGSSEFGHSNWDIASQMGRSVSGITDNNQDKSR